MWIETRAANFLVLLLHVNQHLTNNTSAEVASQTETYEFELTSSHVHKIIRCQLTNHSTQRYNTNGLTLMNCVTESSSPQQNRKNIFITIAYKGKGKVVPVLN
jgi:hypothetical protein